MILTPNLFLLVVLTLIFNLETIFEQLGVLGSRFMYDFVIFDVKLGLGCMFMLSQVPKVGGFLLFFIS